MHIMILGAGIVGIASAYYLNKAGHKVTIIDRNNGVAEETSYANAGQLSFGYTTPWAAPNIPLKALKWLGKSHSPLIIKPDGSLFQLKWLAQMTANCTHTAYSRNQSRMMRISEYSRAMFQQFEQDENIDFEQRHLGTLHLFRDETAFRQHQQHMGVLEQFNVPYQTLTPNQITEYEPALSHMQNRVAGAFRLPNDSTGDCRLFTQKLAQLCEQRGVQFLFNQTINRITTSGNNIQHIEANGEIFEADVFICALGSFSRTLLQQIDLNLPVYPVKGYSITIPITDENKAPQSTILDETYKVALTRFNQRIRVGGMAELSGYQIERPNVHRETLSMVANELFPNSGNTEQAEYWSGLRPMTPDSTPIIGATKFNNLLINTGHGTLGWTMSLASGRIISDLISKGEAEIATHDLNLSRYRCQK